MTTPTERRKGQAPALLQAVPEAGSDRFPRHLRDGDASSSCLPLNCGGQIVG